MAMRIITERKLREFWQENPEAENAMREWIRTLNLANWSSFADIRNTFRSADVYKNCVIFDIGGNKYRIIAKIGYRVHRVYIRFVLTHAEYDKKKWCDDCK